LLRKHHAEQELAGVKGKNTADWGIGFGASWGQRSRATPRALLQNHEKEGLILGKKGTFMEGVVGKTALVRGKGRRGYREGKHYFPWPGEVK